MNKDKSISSIRFLATMMVVILHIFQQLERLNPYVHILTDWLNLGLVLFFCMSGYLYSNRTISHGGWMLHRYKEIVIPSIITVIATLVVYSLCIEVPSVRIIVYSLLSGLGAEAFVPDGWMFIQLWFLTYILVCYLSVPFIQKIQVRDMSEFRFWGMLSVATVVLQSVTMLIKVVAPVPTLSCGVLLRFYLTYFVYRRYTSCNERKKVYRWMTVFSACLFPIVCFVRYILCPDGTLGVIAELLFIYTQTIMGTVFFYYLYEFFRKHPIHDRLIKVSDKYSYAVYLTHCLFIGYETSLIFKCPNIVLGILAALLATAVASICLMAITKKLKK